MRRDRGSDEIRRDIERKRAEMDRTVDELEHRLSPGQLLDQALGWARGAGAGGGARGAAESGAGFVKDHPVPLALLGAGAAWLAAEAASGHSVSIDGDPDVGPGTEGRAAGRRGPYRGDALEEGEWDDDGGGMGDRARSVASSAGDKASSAADSARGAGDKAGAKLGDARDAIGDRMSSAGESASDAARSAARGTKRGARRAKHGLMSALDDNPLAMGAAAFGLGLAGGLAAPTTHWEDEAMGGTADTLKREAQDMAEDVGRAAKKAGAEAVTAAKEEADRQGMGDSLKDSAKRVASEAKDAAKERAREEGLTGEELKRRGKQAGERTKRQAKEEAR